MHATRWRTSAAAVAALVGMSASAGAANYTLAGRFTSNRGKAAQVPLVGATPCGALQFRSRSIYRYDSLFYKAMGANTRAGMDLGCMPHAPGGVAPGVGKKVVTTGMGKGGRFTLPTVAFRNPAPMTTINAIGVTSTPGVLQWATSNSVTGPPAVRLEAPMGTMNDGMNTAAFRVLRQGAWSTQTGRAAAKFTWCPPATVDGAGGPCTHIGQGGFPAIVKYNGTATSFGGTMSYLTHQIQPGSLVQANGAFGIVVPLGPPGENGLANSPATGRGYADHHVDASRAVNIHLTHMEMTVARPIVGPQKLVTMLGPIVAMATAAAVHQWGFPLTTRTVLVRNTGTIGGNPHNITFTAMGYDCVNASGPMCSMATGMHDRNISLVAGAIGVGVLPPPIGNVPSIAIVNSWLPEPGATLQLLVGAALLFAVRRARQG
jgi:hypothetical protein